jgi:hypothetical protein
LLPLFELSEINHEMSQFFESNFSWHSDLLAHFLQSAFCKAFYLIDASKFGNTLFHYYVFASLYPLSQPFFAVHARIIMHLFPCSLCHHCQPIFE